MDQSNQQIFGQFLLVIGGFIFAETIVRNFLSVMSEDISFWVLGSYGILLLILSFSLIKQNLKYSYGNLFSAIYLGLMLFGLYGIKIEIFQPWILAVIIYLIPLIAWILYLFIKRLN